MLDLEISGISNMSLNHYVPDFILRDFADSQEILWILDKRTRKIWPKKPSEKIRQSGYAAFAENDYNPNDVEKLLSQLEGEAAPIIRNIVESARCRKVAVLDHLEKELLCSFLLVQTLRIPRVRNFAVNRDWEVPQGRQLLWYMLRDICAHQLPDGLAAELCNPDLTEHEHLVVIVWKRMTNMIMDVLRIDDPNAPKFVIGDEPCLRKGWLVQSGDLVIMPLTADTYIQMSMVGDSIGEYSECSVQMVEALNAQTLEKSHRFVAGPSQLYLKRISRIEH